MIVNQKSIISKKYWTGWTNQLTSGTGGHFCRNAHNRKKIVRLRLLKGIKQSTSAKAPGTTHQNISGMEQSDSIDHEKLSDVAFD
ncbi:hypothetical protein FHT21_003897 [Pedobacter sp. SG908]|nr:hypothetical protein [Pedobacter sp. SG908]